MLLFKSVCKMQKKLYNHNIAVAWDLPSCIHLSNQDPCFHSDAAKIIQSNMKSDIKNSFITRGYIGNNFRDELQQFLTTTLENISDEQRQAWDSQSIDSFIFHAHESLAVVPQMGADKSTESNEAFVFKAVFLGLMLKMNMPLPIVRELEPKKYTGVIRITGDKRSYSLQNAMNNFDITNPQNMIYFVTKKRIARHTYFIESLDLLPLHPVCSDIKKLPDYIEDAKQEMNLNSCFLANTYHG